MLIEKAVGDNDVVAVKLVSGEEIIGKIISKPVDPNYQLVLSKPVVLGMQQAPNGDVGLGFGPFMLGIDDDVKITLEQSSYITMVKARGEIEKAYIKSTTGLEVPPSGLV